MYVWTCSSPEPERLEFIRRESLAGEHSSYSAPEMDGKKQDGDFHENG
jgi:hypothetical protein